MQFRPRRSVLYMPGANARAMEKARGLPCDAIIFDLEDAVAVDAKNTARDQVAQAVSGGGYGYREVIVRVNGLDTQWGHDDVAAAARLPGAYGGPDSVKEGGRVPFGYRARNNAEVRRQLRYGGY